MINPELDPRTNYYGQFHQELLPLLGEVRGTVLDIGCGSGPLLEHLRHNGAERTIGVELRKDIAHELRESGRVDEVLCLNVESDALPFAHASLDTIIVSHVLEHMVDPWKVLQMLRPLLKPGGRLVGAIPNVRHVSVALRLLTHGSWQYADSGILDRTHLRFFTKKTIRELLESTGYRVLALVPEINGPRARAVSRLSLGSADNLVCHAYNFACDVAPPAG
jgi:2-polyprenyl-3-methyl-5-hydroxy-6-metoxy-1,4-benzoquinol methylase